MKEDGSESSRDVLPGDSVSLESVHRTIVGILADMVRDWDVPGHTEITGATRLVDDLGCSSIDIISLVVAIEEAYGTRKLGFAELLIREGQYVSDLEIAELARFVAGKLQTTGALSPRPIGRI